VPAGFWAPLGSSAPESCEGLSGFYCPGAFADTINEPGGSKPIITPVGQAAETLQVDALEKQVELDISIDDFAANREELIERLAAQYNVDPSLLTLETRAGSVLLTMTIRAADEGGGSDIVTLQQTVAAFNDTGLAAIISEVVGTAVRVDSLPPQRSNVTIEAPFSCPKGWWCTAGNMVPCNNGTYNPQRNQQDARACTPCPPNSNTLHEASTHEDDCLCETGYYDTVVGSGMKCAMCPVGTACSGRGITIDRLPIQPGYFRLGNESIDVRKCPDAAMNCSNAPVCDATTSGCLGGEDSAALCRPGLEGIFCRSCAARDDRVSVYYSSATEDEAATCKECTDTLATVVISIAVVLLAPLVVLGLLQLHKCMGHHKMCHLDPQRWAQLEERWLTYNPLNKIKIMIGIYMIATRIDSVYEVSMPYQVQRIIDMFAITVTFGFTGIGTPLECFGLHGYRAELLVTTIGPFVLALLIVAIAACWLHCKSPCSQPRVDAQAENGKPSERKDGNQRHALMQAALPWVLRFLFLACA